MHPEKAERLAKLRKRARTMRKNPTPGEAAFWEMVRRRKFYRHRFRRQVVIDPHIVDFCCRELGLIVEINGLGHARRWTADNARFKNLKKAGFYVFFFDEDEVIENPGKVWKILAAWRKGRKGLD